MTKASIPAVKKPGAFHNLLSGVLIASGGFMLAAGFFVLKWIGAAGLGVTGLDIVTLAERIRSLLRPEDMNAMSLWIIPSAALIILLLGLNMVRHPRGHHLVSRLVVIIASAATFYPYWVAFSNLSDSLGAGFWVCISGSLVSLLSAFFSR